MDTIHKLVREILIMDIYKIFIALYATLTIFASCTAFSLILESDLFLKIFTWATVTVAIVSVVVTIICIWTWALW